jgi:serine protease inhibitor
MKIRMILALCALTLIACRGVDKYAGHNGGGGAGPAETTQPIGKTTMNSTLAGASNAFGFDLFQRLQREGANKNVFFSPLSVTVALAMTYNGAVGETKKAMARALKIEGMNHAELNSASAELLKALKSPDPKIELAIANSLWARAGVQFNDAFLTRNRQFYGAEIASLDFNNPQSVATINRWVNTSTKGKIGQIIDKIDPQQVMFLVNAVYFKGQWQKRFEKTLTKNQPFHMLGGQQKQAPMMAQSGNYLYYRGDKFQAVSLPYGAGGASLYLFLPDQGSSLDDLLKGFSFQKWEEWMTSFNNTPGDVKLPRFKLDYENSLNEALKALGMGVAFSAREADFSGIREQRDLFISEVKHKAIVEVNEEGTEAAAATSVGVSVTSARPTPERFTFIADRPFLMAIRDSQTGAILFMGAVMEPK